MSTDLDTTFSALADPTRRQILLYLSKQDASVGELARKFPISQPAISQHLRVLEDANLIEKRVDRQRRISHLRAEPLREAGEWIAKYERFWQDKLHRLDGVLRKRKGGKTRGS